jgi:hypothetical protein
MKILSFSVYGHNSIYQTGIIRNLISARLKLPDYKVIVYLSSDQNKNFENELRQNGALVLRQENTWAPNGMFWRFYPIFMKDAERIIVRDADSDIIDRDVAAIREWETSDKDFHIMRDHPLHSAPILGGMWGAKIKAVRRHFNPDHFEEFSTAKGQDQKYLARIYPQIQSSVLIHDPVFRYESESRDFPIKRKLNEFIGEPLSDLGVPLSTASRELIDKFNQSFTYRIVTRSKFRIFMWLNQR